jgi:protein-disulfide isomerase
VWHDLPLPFHERALPAARAAREAQAQRGDRAFWELHDRFFADGAKLGRADLDDDARAMHLDLDKWAAGIDGDGHQAAIDADAAAAERLGFTGTPSFVIVPAGETSGYVLAGAQAFSKFRKLIDRALHEAHK